MENIDHRVLNFLESEVTGILVFDKNERILCDIYLNDKLLCKDLEVSINIPKSSLNRGLTVIASLYTIDWHSLSETLHDRNNQLENTKILLEVQTQASLNKWRVESNSFPKSYKALRVIGHDNKAINEGSFRFDLILE